MDSREAVRIGLDMSQMVALAYVDDMTDDELMKRPDPGCNHIKWQFGHVISSDRQMIEAVAPGSMPALPDGFADRYSKETATSDDPTAFDSKEELLSAYHEQRAGALAALDGLTDEDLSRAAPEEMQAYAPTVGAAFSMLGSHLMMHAGQWAVVRRQLGRPPLF